jgi:hypothetical protein
MFAAGQSKASRCWNGEERRDGLHVKPGSLVLTVGILSVAVPDASVAATRVASVQLRCARAMHGEQGSGPGVEGKDAGDSAATSPAAAMHAGEESAEAAVEKRQALLAHALHESDQELVEVCRCFRSWVARQRQVLTMLAGMPADTPYPVLVAEAERLKCGNELEDLLRAISLFPSTLDQTLMKLPAGDSLQPQGMGMGRESIMVKQVRGAEGVSVEHDWAPFSYKVEDGALVLFSGPEGTKPTATYQLSCCCWEYVHSGSDSAEGRRVIRLRPTGNVASRPRHAPASQPSASPAPGAHGGVDKVSAQEANGCETGEDNTPSNAPGSTKAGEVADTCENGVAEGSRDGVSAGKTSLQDTLVGRWGRSLSLKLRPPDASGDMASSSAGETHVWWGMGRGKVGGGSQLNAGAQQQAGKWWQGISNLGKLGRANKDPTGFESWGSQAELWLRADSAPHAQRIVEAMEASGCTCCPDPSSGDKYKHTSAAPACPAAAPSSSPTPSDSAPARQRSPFEHVSEQMDGVHAGRISTMGVRELVTAMSGLHVTHSACRVAREQLSVHYSSLGARAVEAMLPQMCNRMVHAHLALLAIDSESATALAARPQRSLETWLLDEIAGNLHLGVCFGWTLDAGAPETLVQSSLSADGNRAGNFGGGAGGWASANPGHELAAGGAASGVGGLGIGISGLGNAVGVVGAVGGAALSGVTQSVTSTVTRSLSFVNVRTAGSAADTGGTRSKSDFVHEAYRTLRMRAETALLAGRRIGREPSMDGSETDAMFRRLCRQDEHMRNLYGEKCPFEALSGYLVEGGRGAAAAHGSGGSSVGGKSVGRCELDFIKEELARRNEFVQAQRVLMEQLTRVSAVLACAPKDKRPALMCCMLQARAYSCT